MQAVIDARQHYGRLLALLASRSGDVAGARANAVGRSQSAQAGLAALNEIESKAIASFQPAWLARAYLHELDQSFV